MYSQTSISEDLLFERMSQSPRSIYAVNRPLYNGHHRALNMNTSFWYLQQKKSLYNEHTCNKKD
jgi:hypothetical protein